MTKIKRVLSTLIGTVIAVSSICITPVSAVSQTTETTEFEGYEQIEDYGIFSFVTGTESSKEKYLTYWDTESHRDLIVVEPAIYNVCHVTIIDSSVNMEKYEEIYNKYAEKLDFDHAGEISYADWTTVTFHDNLDANGEISFDVTAGRDIYSTFKKMCAELYDAGIISEASYEEYSMSRHDGFLDYSYGLKIKDISATNDELLETIIAIDDTLEIGSDEYTGADFAIIGIDTPEKFMTVAEAIKTKYPESVLYSDSGFAEEVCYITSGSTNLLTAIQEEASCDTDNSGEIEITDATAILESYANTAAGVAAASEENPMDVNGDGAVGIDDATFGLTVYAELAAGLR